LRAGGKFSDEDIDLVLQRALSSAGAAAKPMTILLSIRRALSYLTQDRQRDKAKQAQWAAPKPKPKGFGTSRY